jgi:hypothetical protein
MKRGDLATYKGNRVRIDQWPAGSKQAVVTYVDENGVPLHGGLPVGVPKRRLTR